MQKYGPASSHVYYVLAKSTNNNSRFTQLLKSRTTNFTTRLNFPNFKRNENFLAIPMGMFGKFVG